MDPFLLAAIEEAEESQLEGGLPIGAVLEHRGVVIGRGRNRQIQHGRVLLHAEIDALENAGRLAPETYRDSTLYVTQAPCPMCCGAILRLGIARVVIGEAHHYAGATALLHAAGVQVEVIDDGVCRRLVDDYRALHPDIWRELCAGA